MEENAISEYQMLGEDGLAMALIMFTNKNDESCKKSWWPHLFIVIQIYLHPTTIKKTEKL